MDDIARDASSPQSAAVALITLFGIMVAGGFGGFVDGLMSGRSYQLRIGSWQKDIGSIGDVLVGMASGLAIFGVAGALLQVEWRQVSQTQQLIRLVAWGVLSGYAGPRLLDPITRQLVKKLSSDAVKEAVAQATTQNAEVQVGLRDADRQLTKFDLQKDELLKDRKWDEIETRLNAVLNQFNAVLEKDSTNAEALRGRAKVYGRKAELARDPKDAALHWDTAIKILTEMIKRDNAPVLAYYQRACYLCKKGAPEAEVLADIKAATAASDNLKQFAKTESAFERLRQSGNQEFKELVG